MDKQRDASEARLHEETDRLDDAGEAVAKMFPNGALATMRQGQGYRYGIPFQMGPEISAALVAAQASCQPIAKDSFNDHHRYRYASMGAVVEAARTAYATNGLAVDRIGWIVGPPRNFGPMPGKDGKATDQTRCGVICTYQIIHRSGQSRPAFQVEAPIVPGKGRDVDKAIAAALSLCHKYAVAGGLNMSWSDEDAEARNDHNSGRNRGRQPEPPPETQRKLERQPKPLPPGTRKNPAYEERATGARLAVRESPFGTEQALKCATGLEKQPGTWTASTLTAMQRYCGAYSKAITSDGDVLGTHEAYLQWCADQGEDTLWYRGAVTAHGKAIDDTCPPTFPTQ